MTPQELLQEIIITPKKHEHIISPNNTPNYAHSKIINPNNTQKTLTLQITLTNTKLTIYSTTQYWTYDLTNPNSIQQIRTKINTLTT